MGLFSLAKLFGVTIRESANDGSDFTNPDADYRRLFLGEDGQLHVKDSAGAVTDIGGTVAEILDIPTAETDAALVLAPDGAGGVEFRAEAGGGSSVPTVVQSKFDGTASTGVTLDATPVAGRSLILVSNSTTGQITSVASTNTTWTQVKTFGPSSGTSYFAIWVGVVGSSPGAAITYSKPGGFNSVLVLEVTDALTPTLGASSSGNSVGSGTAQALAASTSGHLIVVAGGHNDTTLTTHLLLGVPSAGVPLGVCAMLVGYSQGHPIVAGQWNVAGQAGGLITAELS